MPILTTADTTVLSGTTTPSPTFPANFRAISSARVRWKGVNWTETLSGCNYGSTSFPNYPYLNLSHHTWSFSVTARNDEGFPRTCYIDVNVNGWVYSYSQFLAGGESMSVSNSGVIYSNAVGAPCGPAITSYSMTITSASYNTESCGYESGSTYITENPRTTFNGVQVSGPASINNGAWSAWYDITNAQAAAALAGTHIIGGSNRAGYQLEISYHTKSGGQQTVLIDV